MGEAVDLERYFDKMQSMILRAASVRWFFRHRGCPYIFYIWIIPPGMSNKGFGNGFGGREEEERGRIDRKRGKI